MIGAGAALLTGAVLAPAAQAQNVSGIVNTLSQFAGSASTAYDSGPRVSVSQSVISETGDHEITVTGTGFQDDEVVATRPPLAGNSPGIYVIFGKFADEWKPSEGAASSARKVISQFWAVEEDNLDDIGGPSRGGIVLSPEGDFTATFTVSKALAEEKAGDAVGNLGIYTYAGGGAQHAPWETYQPITFGDPMDATPEASAPIAMGSLGSLTAENPVL